MTSPLLLRPVLGAAVAAGALVAPGAAFAAQGWSAPQTLIDGPAVPAALAVAPDSSALAASARLFTTPPGGMTFGAAAPFTPGNVSSTDLATDASGARHVAWTGSGQGHVASAPAGGAFGPRQDLGPAVELDLAVAPDGSAVVAWRVRAGASDHKILVARRPAGGSFGPPQEIAGGVVAANVAAAIDDAGNAVVAWRQIAGRYVIRASRGAAGAAFEAPQTVSQQAADGTAVVPSAVYVSRGVPAVLWSQTGPDAGTRAATAVGGAWTAPQPVSGGGAITTSVAAVPGGGAVAAFDGGEQIEVASAGADGRFGAPVALGPAGGNIVAETVVAVDDAGKVHVAWGTTDDGALVVAEGTPGGPFRRLGQIDWVQPGSGALKMAAGGGGTAVLSWLRVGASPRVLTSVHRPGFTGNPPVGPRPAAPSEGSPSPDGSGPAGARLRLRSRTVRLGRTGTLALRVSSTKAGRATFVGRLDAPRSRRARRLAVATRVARSVPLRARRMRVVRLKLGPSALRAVRRAVRAGRTVRLAVDVSVTDASGAFAQQTLRATLRR